MNPHNKENFYVLDQLPNKLVALYKSSKRWTDLTDIRHFNVYNIRSIFVQLGKCDYETAIQPQYTV